MKNRNTVSRGLRKLARLAGDNRGFTVLEIAIAGALALVVIAAIMELNLSSSRQAQRAFANNSISGFLANTRATLDSAKCNQALVAPNLPVLASLTNNSTARIKLVIEGKTYEAGIDTAGEDFRVSSILLSAAPAAPGESFRLASIAITLLPKTGSGEIVNQTFAKTSTYLVNLTAANDACVTSTQVADFNISKQQLEASKTSTSLANQATAAVALTNFAAAHPPYANAGAMMTELNTLIERFAAAGFTGNFTNGIMAYLNARLNGASEVAATKGAHNTLLGEAKAQCSSKYTPLLSASAKAAVCDQVANIPNESIDNTAPACTATNTVFNSKEAIAAYASKVGASLSEVVSVVNGAGGVVTGAGSVYKAVCPNGDTAAHTGLINVSGIVTEADQPTLVCSWPKNSAYASKTTQLFKASAQEALTGSCTDKLSVVSTKYGQQLETIPENGIVEN